MNNLKKSNFLLIQFVIISGFSAFAQTDSLVFKNGNAIVGEIKSMEKGGLYIETDFSKDDFHIEWGEIAEIYSVSSLLISTSDGRRLYGTVHTEGEQIFIRPAEGGEEIPLSFDEIIFIKSVDQGFLDRLNAGIDLGYSLTKARNQRQFTIRSNAGYLAERWSVDATFNNLRSTQDDVEPIKRTDANLTFRYVLPKEWFILTQVDFLSNTEQQLDLRTNVKLGVGRYIVRSNQMYWGVQAGASRNIENYQGTEDDRESTESWIGTELNLFDIGDLSLLTNLYVYPSLTESDRVRADYLLDLKYDLPLDFYIKTGLTLNYDNQPVEGTSETDYVWQTTFGWSW